MYTDQHKTPIHWVR